MRESEKSITRQQIEAKDSHYHIDNRGYFSTRIRGKGEGCNYKRNSSEFCCKMEGSIIEELNGSR
jgi:hypothetical protein